MTIGAAAQAIVGGEPPPTKAVSLQENCTAPCAKGLAPESCGQLLRLRAATKGWSKALGGFCLQLAVHRQQLVVVVAHDKVVCLAGIGFLNTKFNQCTLQQGADQFCGFAVNLCLTT